MVLDENGILFIVNDNKKGVPKATMQRNATVRRAIRIFFARLIMVENGRLI
jgi:hypothetical protein